MNATQERWLPIPGFEGMYEVSDLGRVKSLARTVGGPRGPRQWRERILSGSLQNNGYVAISLRRAGKTIRRNVHALVLAAFIGPYPGRGYHACHNNGVRTDNRLANLRYDTEVANHADSIRHGTTLRGERQPGHKLTRDDVREIRKAYVPRIVTYKMLGERYGVHPLTVRHVIQRSTWGWLD